MPSTNGHPPVIRMTLHGGPDTGLTAPGVGAETWPWPPPAHSEARDAHTPDRAFQHHLRVTDHAATRLHTHTPTPRPHPPKRLFTFCLVRPKSKKQNKRNTPPSEAPRQTRVASLRQSGQGRRVQRHTRARSVSNNRSHTPSLRVTVCVGAGGGVAVTPTGELSMAMG